MNTAKDTINPSSSSSAKKDSSFLSDNVPPMGIYQTLYKFKDTFGHHMNTPGAGTHPWCQGFPLTVPLTEHGGPELPSSVDVTFEDRFYPKAGGHPVLKQTIADYYNTTYKCSIDSENVMIFAGGRPGIYSVLAFLKETVQVSEVDQPFHLYALIVSPPLTAYFHLNFKITNYNSQFPGPHWKCGVARLLGHHGADQVQLPGG